MTSTIPVRAGAATDRGARRADNQDAHLAADLLYAVADGMGGHAAGAAASALAIAAVGALRGGAASPDDVRAAVAAANAAILAEAGRDPAKAGMGTTVAGVCLGELAGVPHWVVFTVGDSRVYRCADGELARLTVDHTQAVALAAAGALDPAEADRHPLGNVLTRALGTDPAPEPDLLLFPPTAGERFLICSDGLTLELDDATIAERMAAGGDPADLAGDLVALAVAAGGRDNVTAIVVDHLVDHAGEPDPADATDADAAGKTAPRVVA